MMSKKTLMVLVLTSIFVGCGKNGPSENVVSPQEAELQKAVYKSTLNDRRHERERTQSRILKMKAELAKERAKDAQSDRVKILVAELSQLEKEAAAHNAETERIIRERKLKEHQQKVGGK